MRRAIGVAVVMGLVHATPVRAAEPALPGSTTPRPDAEMLLQLDLLRETDLAKQRDLYSKLSIWERLRLLELLGWFEAEADTPPRAPQPKPR